MERFLILTGIEEATLLDLFGNTAHTVGGSLLERACYICALIRDEGWNTIIVDAESCGSAMYVNLLAMGVTCEFSFSWQR